MATRTHVRIEIPLYDSPTHKKRKCLINLFSSRPLLLKHVHETTQPQIITSLVTEHAKNSKDLENCFCDMLHFVIFSIHSFYCRTILIRLHPQGDITVVMNVVRLDDFAGVTRFYLKYRAYIEVDSGGS